MVGKYIYRNLRVHSLFILFPVLGFVAFSQSNEVSDSARLTMPGYDNLPVQEGYLPGADNVRLFYRVVGKGSRTIVFVHGGPGLGFEDGGYDLEATAAKGFRFMMYNQRGGGRSELISDELKLGVDYYVRDLEAFRQHFGLTKMNLIGLSWGSGIVAHYAARYPQRISRIVLLSPMPPTEEFAKQRSQKVRSLIDSKTLAEINELHKTTKNASDEDLPKLCRELEAHIDRLYVADHSNLARARGNICNYTPQALRARGTTTEAAIKSLGNWNFESILKQIMVPVLVIEGDKSNVPIDATEAWARWLPNAHLLLIANAGHMNWIDKPDAVISSLSEFFRGRGVKDAKRVNGHSR